MLIPYLEFSDLFHIFGHCDVSYLMEMLGMIFRLSSFLGEMPYCSFACQGFMVQNKDIATDFPYNLSRM